MRTIRGLMSVVVTLVAIVAVASVSVLTTVVQLAATALIMGGTGMKPNTDPSQVSSYMNGVNSVYLNYDPADLKFVTTPENFWPETGITDATFNASVAAGLLKLDDAIRTTSGQKVVVGYSQSANIATREKRILEARLAQGDPTAPTPDDLSFLLLANPNRPNGGILARFPGLYIPILDVTFDGATPDGPYSTIDVARQYDAISDFPLYPLNLLADLNALMGYFYLHPNYWPGAVDLTDPSTYQSYTSGNTTYYFVYTEHLPLLQPLRDLGVPKPLLSLVEPVLRVLIELAYDRTPENMGVPTSAKLFGPINIHKLVTDLAAAVQQGIHDALSDLGITLPAARRGPAIKPPTDIAAHEISSTNDTASAIEPAAPTPPTKPATEPALPVHPASPAADPISVATAPQDPTDTPSATGQPAETPEAQPAEPATTPQRIGQARPTSPSGLPTQKPRTLGLPGHTLSLLPRSTSTNANKTESGPSTTTGPATANTARTDRSHKADSRPRRAATNAND